MVQLVGVLFGVPKGRRFDSQLHAYLCVGSIPGPVNQNYVRGNNTERVCGAMETFKKVLVEV